jgi:aryl-alcohol dehydrogenase-like predicted oxidoreductase
LAQGNDIVPIPGTKKIKYLEENLGALTVEITLEENEEIRAHIAKVDIVGGRYPANSFNLYSDTPEL